MKLLKKIAIIPSATFLFLANKSVYAQKKDYLEDITEGVQQDLGSWVTTTINWAIGIATLICVVMLIASGYSYITAGGDEAKIQKATKTLTWAIVGLVICFISVILVQFVLKNVLNKQ